jgi:hypothetical protein
MGTSEWDSVRYRLDDLVSTDRTPLLAEALVQILKQTDQPVTSVVFLGTPEALAQLGSRWLVQRKRIESMVNVVHQDTIPSGDDADGRWEILRTVAHYLKREPIPGIERDACDDVIFDITHGYRAQSFLGGAAVSWFLAESAREATWGVEAGGDAAMRALADKLPRIRVLYGVHEPGEGQDDPDYVAPVWDLSEYITAANWTHALQALRYGRGDYAAVLGRLHSQRLVAAARQDGVAGVALQPFNFAADLGKALAKFADDLALVRVVDILKGRTGQGGGSAAGVLELLRRKDYDDFVRYLPVAEQALIDLRRELETLDLRAAVAPGSAAPRITSPEGVRAMIDLARLYGRLQRFAEAAIVLREAVVSTFGINHTTANLPDPAEPGCRVERGRVEKALRVAVDEREEEDTGYTSADAPPTLTFPLPDDLRKHARVLRQNRNDIEHGSFNDSPAYAHKLRNAVWERVRELTGFVDHLGRAAERRWK